MELTILLKLDGKVLSGLVKRIDRRVKVSAINIEEDISNLKKTYGF